MDAAAVFSMASSNKGHLRWPSSGLSSVSLCSRQDSAVLGALGSGRLYTKHVIQIGVKLAYRCIGPVQWLTRGRSAQRRWPVRIASSVVVRMCEFRSST